SRIVAQSFQGEPPDTGGFDKRETGTGSSGLLMDHRMRRGVRAYVTVPLDTATGQSVLLHALFSERERARSRVAFGLGLAIIGLIVALLVIPVSRLITKPVNRLRSSALRIADGDLDHRVDLRSRDEIGELGQAFNHMADKLWGLIQSGKKLTAHVSHELRSPLARIRVAEELIRDKIEQQAYDSCEPYLDSIREEIGELDRLIGRILELSKLDLEDDRRARQRLDLTAILKEVLSRFAPAFRQKSLRIASDLPQSASIFGQRDDLLSAFSNLFDNAAKFTPEEGDFNVKIQVETAGIHITLTNTSEALPEEELTRIFDPFYRIVESDIPGSGLGLSITRRIIEKHGGRIQAFNSAEGFKIEIILPLGGGAPG
ncbi:MAG: HAMP domain-containing histidine kinase, partial [Deltaproteobacteria bacterium]|nr:HAMP domain-containing histidine kinase [Deltaproteobacteria bacterium]